jgi:hypothetical protein
MRKLVIGGLTLAGILLSGASASAATIIGQAPPPGNPIVSCGLGDWVQNTVAAGVPSYTVPGPGVITEWRTFGNPADGFGNTDIGKNAAFRVFTFQANGDITAVFDSGSQQLAAGLNKFPVNIPVAGGEHIGLQTLGAAICRYGPTGDPADELRARIPAQPVGTSAPTLGPTTQQQLDVAAVFEPDECLADPTTLVDCVSPETTITKKPTKKHRRRSIVRFESSEPGSTFTCVLDGSDGHVCTSPTNYRDLDSGRHDLLVAATDAAGNTDPSPAETQFFLKKKR